MAGAPSDWQFSCTEMKQRGLYLLRSGQWSDCTFLVGVEPNQVIISVHKLILAMASPVFEAMFFGGMAERNEPIAILDVQPDAFKALLEYIYTDNINITSFDKACELCYGAKKYMLPHLVKECTRFLWSDLNPRNACRAFEFARLFEESVLMDKCLQIISTNTKEVLHDSSFEEVELNTVIVVFSLPKLNIDSELDLFEAALRYAKAQDKKNPERSISPAVVRKSPEPSTSKEKVVNVESSAENSPEAEAGSEPPAEEPKAGDVKSEEGKDKPSVRSALQHIRFLTLTPQQFAEGPARSPLLTESEAFAVLMNILSASSAVPMPEGFSQDRLPRKPCVATFTVDTPSPGEPHCVADHMAYVPRPPRPDVPGNRMSPFALEPGASFLVPQDVLERASAESSKLCCLRPVIHHTECLNTSVLDCSATFVADKNVCLLGVQVPTQVPNAVSSWVSAPYSELLYAHLLDADGARLTYTHYTGKVPYRHLLDVMFNRPVYIQKNKVYKVGIVFNKVGWYPLGTCANQVSVESVFFQFGMGQSGDSVRDGLIRSIIFTY